MAPGARPLASDVGSYGLRLAGAIFIGLMVEILRGAPLPPLAPIIALQLLAAPGPAPPGKLAIGLLGLVALSSGLAYAVALITTQTYALYAAGSFLVYLWGFGLAFLPGAAGAAGGLALTMGIVVMGQAASSTGLAAFIVAQLLVSAALGLGLVYAMHAAFPHLGPRPPRPPMPEGARSPGARAVVAALVMMPLHLYLTAGGGAALVVLITAATLLRQPDMASGVKHAADFALGNLMGGLLAAATVAVAVIRPEMPAVAAALAPAALLVGWRMAARRAAGSR
ncbi:MAG: hypothetical protein AAF676_13520, partial [Pseudomonadota bacterium]